MDKIEVKCNSRELMRRADKEFDIVTHKPEEDSKADFSGEFIVMDTRSEDDIIDKVKQIHDDISNTVV